MINSRRAAILIPLLFVGAFRCSNVSEEQLNKEEAQVDSLARIPNADEPKPEYDSLKKYSYFLIGFTKYAPTVDCEVGTCFFIKEGKRLTLITAGHVLTGWDPYSHKFIIPYPDTMFVRLVNKETGKPELFSIDMREVKRKQKKFYRSEYPDLGYIDVHIPDKYSINSIEHFFSNYVLYNPSPEEVVYFGFLSKNNARDAYTYSLTSKPVEVCGQVYGNNANSNIVTRDKDSAKYTDSLHFIIDSIKEWRSFRGNSGSPVFLKYKNPYDSSKEVFILGGVITDGDDTLRVMYSIKPRILYNWIRDN